VKNRLFQTPANELAVFLAASQKKLTIQIQVIIKFKITQIA
jgi:hypothetical protein